MAKTGRPKLEKVKTKIVGIRLLESEYQRLKEYASKRGKTITDVMSEGIKKIIGDKEIL